MSRRSVISDGAGRSFLHAPAAIRIRPSAWFGSGHPAEHIACSECAAQPFAPCSAYGVAITGMHAARVVAGDAQAKAGAS